MIILFCKCGERYVVEEKFIGSSIICKVCGNLQPIIPSSYSPRPSATNTKPIDSGWSYRAGLLVARYKRLFPKITPSGAFLALVLAFCLFSIGTIIYQSQSKQAKTQAQTLPASTSAPTPSATDSKDKETAQAKVQQSTPGKQPVETLPEMRMQDLKPVEQYKPAEIPTQQFEKIPPTELEPANPNRLHTGAAPLGRGIREGRCTIKVVNGTDTDALVRVMSLENGEQLFRNFYILAGSTFNAEMFPGGDYVLKVAFGSDWNEGEKRFNFRRSFEKTELFTLTETTTREPTAEGYVDRTRFSNMTLTLHKVVNGNFHSNPISEAEFWR